MSTVATRASSHRADHSHGNMRKKRFEIPAVKPRKPSDAEIRTILEENMKRFPNTMALLAK